MVHMFPHNQSETKHWFTPLNLHHELKRKLLGCLHYSKRASLLGLFSPWFEVNEAIIGNLSLIIGSTANSTVEVMVTKQTLNFLVRVLLNNIALDCSLAKQRSICAVADTSCCPGRNKSQWIL